MSRALVLDAGALIALDRNERSMWAMLRVATEEQAVIQVPAAVIAQAWRDGTRQALLSRALSHCDEVPLNGATARAAGLLCGRAGAADVVDATVALAAAALGRDGDVTVVTSDPDDIGHLAAVLGANPGLEHP